MFAGYVEVLVEGGQTYHRFRYAEDWGGTLSSHAYDYSFEVPSNYVVYFWVGQGSVDFTIPNVEGLDYYIHNKFVDLEVYAGLPFWHDYSDSPDYHDEVREQMSQSEVDFFQLATSTFTTVTNLANNMLSFIGDVLVIFPPEWNAIIAFSFVLGICLIIIGRH